MSRGRVAAYMIVAVAAYAAAAAVTAPATWLTRALEDASAGRLQAGEISGTVWTGSARLFVRTPDQRALDLGVLRWTARPAGLFPPRIGAALRLPAAAQPVLLQISPAAIAVERLDLQLSAALLPALVPALATFGPEGTVRLRSESLRLERNAYFGLAEVEWRRAALAGQPGIALGSHIARLRGAGERVDIDLGTLEGALHLSGKATWRPSTRFEIAGTAEARAPEIASLLQGFCASYQASTRTCHFSFRAASEEKAARR